MSKNKVINQQSFHDGKVVLYQLENRPRQKWLCRIKVPNGPGMTIFSPDGKYGYVVSSFTPEMVVIDTKTHKTVATVKQASPFSPDLAATPDGKRPTGIVASTTPFERSTIVTASSSSTAT